VAPYVGRPFQGRRGALLTFLALLLAAPSLPAHAITPDRRVVIVAPDEADARVVAIREAIAFWNEMLAGLNVPTRLLEAKLLVAPPMTRPLENYTRAIWLLAGRTVPKGGEPRPPKELTDLDGDIVVFLSRQVMFSFARPFGDDGARPFQGRELPRFFMGIQTGSEPPLTYPNVSRNVVAHEFGHALGLEHNGSTRTLMCGPCEHLLYQSDERMFFPLTTEERTRLVTLHGAP
jgi:hypothetical protein